MKKESLGSKNLFESIKHIDEDGKEYWYARELMVALGYKDWRYFETVIIKAKEACKSSDISVIEHFVVDNKMFKIGNNAKREKKDFKLTRYACYLIAQNANSRLKSVGLAQTYFAVQTRKQEILEIDEEQLTEDEKRFRSRWRIKKKNALLNQAAKDSGVKNFDQFHNYGYKGLYNGETADDIAKRKRLRYREEILDNMGSDELIANEFRISLANQKLRNEKIRGERNADIAHYEVGKSIRKTIAKHGGTMPENLPTPKKSLKQLEKERKNKRKELSS